jgi:hypothetical protein
MQNHFRNIIIFLSLFNLSFITAQNFNRYTWKSATIDTSKITSEFPNADLIILDEHINLNLLNFSKLIQKTCILKVNTESGVQQMATLTLPESFDKAGDGLQMPHTFSETNTPFLYDFKIVYFAARKLKKNGTIENCTTDYSTKKIYWIAENGDHISDYNYIFKFNNIEVGDIVEYTYQIEFKGGYSFNHFYFNSTIPKQNTEFTIICFPHPLDYDFICNINVADSSFQKINTAARGETPKWKCTYRYKNLKPINYPLNSCTGKSLPHLYLDNRRYGRGPHFEWRFRSEVVKNEKAYNRQHASIRKFISNLPKTDSTNREIFLLALNKNLNDLKFASAESMNYGEEAQYTVNSSVWLTKGKLIEEFMKEVYEEILDEADIPYKIICLHDKRLGELKSHFRAEPKYERYFFAIPNNNNLLYMMHRENGLKYYIGEIPFYYEGVTAAILLHHNTTTTLHDSSDSLENYKFFRTQSSTENENVRAENALLKVNLDSSTINVLIKENISGQFSTIIRSLYLNETIDSTINPIYFKKCITKPNSAASQIKLISKSDYFPFKYSFNCTEKIALLSKSEIPLKDWFSFTYNKKIIPQRPNFDYYVDFKYTDTYSYMFEFNKPTEVINVNDFTKSINNKYFDLSSKLVKQTEAGYLLSVMLKVKQSVIPEIEGEVLLEIANSLDELNDLVIKLK